VSVSGGFCTAYLGTVSKQLPTIRLFFQRSTSTTPVPVTLKPSKLVDLHAKFDAGKCLFTLRLDAGAAPCSINVDTFYFEFRKDLGPTYTLPLVSSLLLPAGTHVVQRDTVPPVRYQFVGYRFEPTTDRKQHVALLCAQGANAVRPVILDPRTFALSDQGPATDVDAAPRKREARFLTDTLWKKCCQQTIRGVSLLDLFNYLSFETGKDMRVAIVGGAVRDVLRRKLLTKINDIDVMVSGCGYNDLRRHILDFFALRGRTPNESVVRTTQKSQKFGMLKVVRDPATDNDDLDIGLCKARHAVLLAGAGGVPDTANEYLYGASYFMDALTRDYTINAIYVDVCRREVYDPTGALSNGDHVYDHKTATVTQRLVSAPLALVHRAPELAAVNGVGAMDALQVMAADVGGQFRYFKEMSKHQREEVRDYTTHQRGKLVITKSDDLGTLYCVANLLQFSRDEWIKTFLKDHFPQHPFDPRDPRVRTILQRSPGELWVGKMVKKLFADDATLHGAPGRRATISARAGMLGMSAEWQAVDDKMREVARAIRTVSRTGVVLPKGKPQDIPLETDVIASGMYLDLSDAFHIAICHVLCCLDTLP